MYMPVDPNAFDNMWDKLFLSLCTSKNCLVITDGIFKNSTSEKVLDEQESKKLLDVLQKREYVRIGSSRMNPIPAHFSLSIENNAGRLMELVSLTCDDERLKNDLILVCQFAFFENKEMRSLEIPLLVKDLEDPELRFEFDDNEAKTTAYRVIA